MNAAAQQVVERTTAAMETLVDDPRDEFADGAADTCETFAVFLETHDHDVIRCALVGMEGRSAEYRAGAAAAAEVVIELSSGLRAARAAA